VSELDLVHISVIIPTLNRCEMLAEALTSVGCQTFPSEQYEIIVVDNGSTDGTAQLVKQLNHGVGKPIRYVYEARPGLHWARHAGARAARGDVLAFTDDDAVATPGWLVGLAAAYDDPHVGAAGGPIYVRWRTPPPAWVPPLGTFGHLDYGVEYQEPSWPRMINGGNFSVRKRALFEVGGFNPDTSVEDRLVGDGERGLCRKLYSAGWKIVYVPHALVYHVQDGATITLAKMRHRYAQQARFLAYADYKAKRQSTARLIRRTGRMLLWAADRKLRALKHWPAKDMTYYQHEVNTAAALASAEYYLHLAFSQRFRQIVLREDWINEPADDKRAGSK
jgi:cellulose synthase/poly-beta-1,6-N-acetylglucosamine synthase-like glycosyltransferase